MGKGFKKRKNLRSRKTDASQELPVTEQTAEEAVPAADIPPYEKSIEDTQELVFPEEIFKEEVTEVKEEPAAEPSQQITEPQEQAEQEEIPEAQPEEPAVQEEPVTEPAEEIIEPQVQEEEPAVTEPAEEAQEEIEVTEPERIGTVPDEPPHWIHKTKEDPTSFIGIIYLPECTCSVCGYEAGLEKPVCPRCGTKMK